MDTNLNMQIEEALKSYLASGVEEQVDYQKSYIYSIVTNSTAIEGSTVTEIENQLLFDEGIAAKGRSLTEQMMNVDLKDVYLHAFRIAAENPTYTPKYCSNCQLWLCAAPEVNTPLLPDISILQKARSDCAMSVPVLAEGVILHIII